MYEIKKAHAYNITEFQHYSDKKNKRDLILSIPAWIFDIKLWDINRLECIYNFKNKVLIDDWDSDAFVYTACFLCNNMAII